MANQVADVYAFAVTDEERAETLARRDADDACSQPACRTVMEKPGRGAAPRPILHMCERHRAEHQERHERAMASYREAQRTPGTIAYRHAQEDQQ